MGATHSRKKYIHDSIHLSGIPTTSISSTDHQSHHITPQIHIPTSSTSTKSKSTSKWISFAIFNHMKQITNSINFSAESMRMAMETPHSITSPTTDTSYTNTDDETESDQSDHDHNDNHDNQDIIITNEPTFMRNEW